MPNMGKLASDATPAVMDGTRRVLRKIRKFVFHYEYLNMEQLRGFVGYKYKGLDTNPFNNHLAMPICDLIVKLIPPWLAPNVLTMITFVLSLSQYLVLSYYDYQLYASSNELTTERIPNWVWLFSGCVMLACIMLDALDGKHARRIGACSPIGELLDHSVDTWRIGAPAVTCFYSIFGRLHYGIAGYRLMWLMLATQCVITVMFWQQYITGVMLYSWGHDIMQYMMAWFYFHTWYRDGADYWQADGWCIGTNAEVTETWTHLMIFGVSLPMQLYHFIKYYRSTGISRLPLKRVISPVVPALAYLFITFILSQRNLYDSVLEEDPRCGLWLTAIVFCNVMWWLLIAIMTGTRAPQWNGLLSFLILCTFYWFIRPGSLLRWDRISLIMATVIATVVHAHAVVSTLNQMCRHFGLHLFFIKQIRPRGRSGLA